TTRITMITGHPSVKSIVRNLYGPNISYLIKPIDLAQLEALLDDSPVPDLDAEKHFGYLVGESEPMQKLYQMIERVCKTQANVLLMGLTDTLDHLIELLHRLGFKSSIK